METSTRTTVIACDSKLLKGTDNWALAQLCVEHLQPAKTYYLQRLAEADPPIRHNVTTGGTYRPFVGLVTVRARICSASH